MRGSPSLVVLPLSAGWGPEITLDHFLFFQCLVGGSAGFWSSRARPAVFQKFECFSDLGILVGLPMSTSFLESVPPFQPFTIIG